MKIPEIAVGIMSGSDLSFTLNGTFSDERGILRFTGRWNTVLLPDKIILTDGKKRLEIQDGFLFYPDKPSESSFILHNVTIGIDFHWERREDQSFRGALRIIAEEGKLTAVNIITVEDYLTSVISSEMSATSSQEFLKAHAVISRSWLLAQIEKSKILRGTAPPHGSRQVTGDEIIRWYDREDHNNYDVCADDHCQRYQGITRVLAGPVEQAVSLTAGEVLRYNHKICDARFYKCCGGVTELFENVWEPVNHPYLQKVFDAPRKPPGREPDLRVHEEAEKWIEGSFGAFCSTSDKAILSQVLNDYDRETVDFYRWKISYSQDDLSRLVREKTGIDFGEVTDIVPLERGVSGRITRLKITGTAKEMIIGKELEIRKALSKSHLYSSCFVVRKSTEGEDVVFTIKGAGWGHGVGLCQIGAAVMGAKGYSYRRILSHYFKGAKLEKIY